MKEAVKFHSVNMSEKVPVKVISVTDDVVNVKLLDKKLIGSFKKELSTKTYKKNDKFEAHILWQDPKTQHVYIHPEVKLKRMTNRKF